MELVLRIFITTLELSKMKRFIILIFIIFNLYSLKSQNTFQKVYGGKLWADQLSVTDDKGFIVSYAGPFTGYYSPEVLEKLDAGVIKLDSNYQVQWTRSFSGEGVYLDRFEKVIQHRGNYYAVGVMGELDNEKTLLTKLDKNGNEVWTKSFNGIAGTENIQVIDDQLWITVFNYVNGRSSGFLILDEDGVILEQKIFLTNREIIFRGVNKFNDEYYITGVSSKEGDDWNILLGKLSSNKQLLWLNEYDNKEINNFKYGGHSSVSIANDELFINYRNHQPEMEQDSNRTIIVMKTSLEGVLLRGVELRLPNANFDLHNWSPEIIYNNKIFIGVETSVQNNFNPGLLTMDLNLNNIHLKRFLVAGFTPANVTSLNLLSDGILISGREYFFNDTFQGFFLIKTTFQGNSACSEFDSKVLKTDITTDYLINSLRYVAFARVVIEDVAWDTTYTPEIDIIYNCEKNYLSLLDQDTEGHCKGDEVKLSIYGKEGDLSWNIELEDIIEEKDNEIIFIIREDKIIEVIDNSNDRVAQLEIKLNCHEVNNADMKVSQTLSPNEDGFNDLWEIKNIQLYPEHEVFIVDQLGNKVFKAKRYKNDWDGDSLPTGIYYYVVLRTSSDKEPLSGRLIINY